MSRSTKRSLHSSASGPAANTSTNATLRRTGSWATRRLTTRDLAWAALVVVMESRHRAEIRSLWPDHVSKVRVLAVPDDYDPGEPELHALLAEKLRALLTELQPRPRGPDKP